MVKPRIDVTTYASGNGALSFNYSRKKYYRGQYVEVSCDPDFLDICNYYEEHLKPKGYKLVKKNGLYLAAMPVHKFEDGKICMDGENCHFEFDDDGSLWSVHSDGDRGIVHPLNFSVMAIKFWLKGGFEVLL